MLQLKVTSPRWSIEACIQALPELNSIKTLVGLRAQGRQRLLAAQRGLRAAETIRRMDWYD